MEYVNGGLAAICASFFTNPLEVIKHHMELNKKTNYASGGNKSGFLTTGYAVAKNNGWKSLQKGLPPALGAHLVSYGMKLGTYEFAQNRGFTKNEDGKVIVSKSIMSSGAGGLLGQYLSSPFYYVKIQHEAAPQKVQESGYMTTVKKIYKEQGIRGFFRGATASLPRAFIGTSQLTSFAVAKEQLMTVEAFKKNPLMSTVVASTIAGLVLSICMTPFDMVLTKLYKKAINPSDSVKYEGFLDCVKKTYLSKGYRPFVQGIGPLYIKLGPHTILCLVFWEQLKDLYNGSQKEHLQTNSSSYNFDFFNYPIEKQTCESYFEDKLEDLKDFY